METRFKTTLVLLFVFLHIAICHGNMSGQPKVRAVQRQRNLKSKAPASATMSPTTSVPGSDYSLPSMQEAYDLFNYKHAEAFWEIIKTNTSDVGVFLDAKGRAKGMTKKVLNKLKALLPEEILALEAMNDDEFLLTTLMQKESSISLYRDDDETGGLRMLEDDTACILAVAGVFMAIINALFGIVGLSSVGTLLAKTIGMGLARIAGLRSAALAIFSNKSTSIASKIGETASLLAGELSLSYLFSELVSEMSPWEEAFFWGGIAVDLAVTWLSLATPAGGAIWFAKFAAAHAVIALAALTMSSACKESVSPAPTALSSGSPTTAIPTLGPTMSPNNVPTIDGPSPSAPIGSPNNDPTNGPSTREPSPHPTEAPTNAPPTRNPTLVPTRSPTKAPTFSPSTRNPSAPTMKPTSAPQAEVPKEYSKETTVTADPHFLTWNGNFDYQGACDVVYILTERLRIHLRLEFASAVWSKVSSAALALGSDVIEVQLDKTLYINGTLSTSPPSIVGGSYPLTLDDQGLRIDLAGGQYVAVKYFGTSLTVSAKGFESEFGASLGLAGSFYEDIVQDRSGETLSGNASVAANVWKVNPLFGDPELFIDPSPYANQTCQDSLELPVSTDADREAAENACAHIPDDEMRKDCVFDILASGDPIFASNPVYTEVSEPLESICVAGVNGVNSSTSGCSDAGGTCVWRCNTVENVCLQDLCSFSDPNFTALDEALTGSVEGCSCAVPIPAVDNSTINEEMTCIAVIDESSQSSSTLASRWDLFRASYPLRAFCLLQPNNYPPSALKIPSAFSADNRTTFAQITRDNGQESLASDWYTLCNLEALRIQGINRVALFVDNSGSLNVWEVAASQSLLQGKLESKGAVLVDAIYNNLEDYISPFISDFV